MLANHGELAGALESYRLNLAEQESLVERDPTNVSFLDELGATYCNVADTLRDMGYDDRALEFLHTALGTFEDVVEMDPASVGWRQHVPRDRC